MSDNLAKIKALQEELIRLEQANIEAIYKKRSDVIAELKKVEEVLESLGDGKTVGRKGPGLGRFVTVDDLISEIRSMKDGVVNVRKAGLNLRLVKRYVLENPDKLVICHNGPWAKVRLK